MTAITFYFQIHQPWRLRRYSFFDIGKHNDYFDNAENERIFRRVVDKCYRPMTLLLERLIQQHDGAFRCSFSISGCALGQMERWSPETLEIFQRLAKTGCVEFLAETSHHSLAALINPAEFREQVRIQHQLIERLFGQSPKVFRNTELITSNFIAREAEEMGYQAIMAEGADHILDWRSPHFVYRPEGCDKIKTLLRSYRLSDDIAFRFSNKQWASWPMSADNFRDWLNDLDEKDEVVGLFMDYETFGEHQWEDTGIFEFMEHLPAAILSNPRFHFATPSEVAEKSDPVSRLDIPHPFSWADAERDLTAWLDNPMQRAAHESVHELGEAVHATGDPHLLETWRRLTTSDHFYYMCVKFFSDGDVHKYFSPYATPHDAYISLMNVLGDLRRRLGVPLEGLLVP